MLEGKPEIVALSLGKFLADRLAVLRINHGLRRDIYNFVKQNKISISFFLQLSLLAIRYSLKRKYLPAWPTLLMCGLLYGRVDSGWISAPKYWTKFHRLWGSPVKAVSDVKTLTRKLSKSDQLPDLGYFIDGQFWNTNWEIVPLEDIVDSNMSDTFVVKRDYSERGKHVLELNKKEFLAFDFKTFGNCVIQRKINQLNLLSKLSGGSTVTVRVLTGMAKNSGDPQLLSCLLKFNEPTSKVRRNFTIPIELESFKTKPFGYDEKFHRFELPLEFLNENTGFKWLEEAIQLAINTHRNFPHFRIIGWDIGIDELGKAWIYEWNADHPALIRAQGFYGPIFVRSGMLESSEVQ